MFVLTSAGLNVVAIIPGRKKGTIGNFSGSVWRYLSITTHASSRPNGETQRQETAVRGRRRASATCVCCGRVERHPSWKVGHSERRPLACGGPHHGGACVHTVAPSLGSHCLTRDAASQDITPSTPDNAERQVRLDAASGAVRNRPLAR